MDTRGVRWTAMSVCAAMLAFAGCAGSRSVSPALAPGGSAPSAIAQAGNQAAAGPVTWHVQVGGAERSGAVQALNFFADAITIDEGDSVTFTVGGNAHTVTFFGPLKQPKMPIGRPWGGHTYNGDFYVSSGAMFPGQSYTLTFTKAGTFPYECLFHDPEMAGVVIVQHHGTPYPHSQSYYDTQGRQEMNRELAAALGSIDEFPYADGGTSLAMGIAPGLNNSPPSHGTVLRFLDADTLTFDSEVTVRVGTTLTWTNLSNNEPHTVTFPLPGHTPNPNQNPFGPPEGGPDFTGHHSANSGAMFPGQSYSLTFTAPGAFKYYCLFHYPFGMMGTVTVK